MSEEKDMGEEPQNKKIMDLKQGESSVSIKARVLETGDTKTIETKKGTRTISEAILGDDTGRIKATFWGDKAGSVQEGQAVEVKGAWTTSFRGKVQLNVGSSSEVSQIDDSEVPQKDEVPESEPTAPMEDRGYGSRRQGGGRRDYRQGRNYPRKREW